MSGGPTPATTTTTTTTTPAVTVDSSSESTTAIACNLYHGCENRPLYECQLENCFEDDFVLNGRGLTGTIPPMLGSCTFLKFLDLDSNALTGTIPANLGSLVQARHLVLSNNKLSGELPSSLGSMTNLRELQVHGNQFHGEIPNTMCPVVEDIDLCTFSDIRSGLTNNFGCHTSLCAEDLREHCNLTCQPQALVAGSVVGGLLLLAVIIAVIIVIRKIQKSHSRKHSEEMFHSAVRRVKSSDVFDIDIPSLTVRDMLLPSTCVDLKHVELIAAGGAGCIYRAPLAHSISSIHGEHIPKRSAVALKEMFSMIMGVSVDEFAREIRFLSSTLKLFHWNYQHVVEHVFTDLWCHFGFAFCSTELHHKNIVPFYGVYHDQEEGVTLHGR